MNISHSIKNINKETEIMKKSQVDSGSEKYNKWNKNLVESSTVDLNWQKKSAILYTNQ